MAKGVGGGGRVVGKGADGQSIRMGQRITDGLFTGKVTGTGALDPKGRFKGYRVVSRTGKTSFINDWEARGQRWNR
jgi:hypothetical protein